MYMYLAFFVELLLTFTLCYVEAFNTGFGTRDLLFIMELVDYHLQ